MPLNCTPAAIVGKRPRPLADSPANCEEFWRRSAECHLNSGIRNSDATRRADAKSGRLSGELRFVRPTIAALAASLALAATAAAAPIVDTGTPSLPAVHGRRRRPPHKVKDPSQPPQNPYMAPNPNSNIHNDTWMTDAYKRSGPLGNNLISRLRMRSRRRCAGRSRSTRRAASSASARRSVAAPTGADHRPEHARDDLRVHAPDRPRHARAPRSTRTSPAAATSSSTTRTGSWSPTKTDHIFVLNEGADGNTLTLEARLRPDLGARRGNRADHLGAARLQRADLVRLEAERQGRDARPEDRRDLKVKTLGEEIENSFAVAEDGVYIVSDKRMYRFKANADGMPRVDLEEGLSELRDRQAEPGERRLGDDADDHGQRLVAITDNADPMNVVVYRTQEQARQGREARSSASSRCSASARARPRTRCMTAGRSLIVENNYGYQDPFGPNAGAVTEPGLRARRREQEAAPSASGVDEHRGPGADRGPEAVDEDRPDLRLHPAARPRRRRATTGPRSTAAPATTVWSQYAGSGLSLQQQLRRARARARRHRLPRA